MGTNFMNGPKPYRMPVIRGEQGIGNQSRFIGRAAGGAAQKNLAVAERMGHFMKLKPSSNTAAARAPGPRKV